MSGPPGASAQPSSSSSSQPDKTPSPISTGNLVAQPLVSPVNSNMSVASMVSPTTPGSADPRRFDSAPNSATLAAGEHEPLSRRESVDSRINQGFGEMRLGNSPYASHNQSTASIHASLLQQQRNPRPGLESLAVHRISNGYQPSADRNPDGQPKTVRTAPAITGPATSQIARAAEPTKGQAWAFPEEEIQRLPSAASQSLVDSRRSSVADSIASSQYTTESRLPPGQRRLDDGLSGPEYQRLSSASADYPTTHHHALQHKQLADLLQDEAAGLAGSQPYSRTPELRMSHKLAERKRRTEMKELFEQLRDLMPQERGSKASKWEILTKGRRLFRYPRRRACALTASSHLGAPATAGQHQTAVTALQQRAGRQRYAAARNASAPHGEPAAAGRPSQLVGQPGRRPLGTSTVPVRSLRAGGGPTGAAAPAGLERRAVQRSRVHDWGPVRAAETQRLPATRKVLKPIYTSDQLSFVPQPRARLAQSVQRPQQTAGLEPLNFISPPLYRSEYHHKLSYY